MSDTRGTHAELIDRLKKMADERATDAGVGDPCPPEAECDDCDTVRLLRDAVEALSRNTERFTCAARRGKTDPPQDCDWPFCGCDEHATKVIESLQECDLLRQRTASEPPK